MTQGLQDYSYMEIQEIQSIFKMEDISTKRNREKVRGKEEQDKEKDS